MDSVAQQTTEAWWAVAGRHPNQSVFYDRGRVEAERMVGDTTTCRLPQTYAIHVVKA